MHSHDSQLVLSFWGKIIYLSDFFNDRLILFVVFFYWVIFKLVRSIFFSFLFNLVRISLSSIQFCSFLLDHFC